MEGLVQLCVNVDNTEPTPLASPGTEHEALRFTGKN